MHSVKEATVSQFFNVKTPEALLENLQKKCLKKAKIKIKEEVSKTVNLSKHLMPAFCA